MKHLFILFPVLILLSCGKCNYPVQEKIVTKEVIRTEHILDTVLVSLPVEYKEVFKQDSSYLESSVAWSSAVVGDNGVLHHILSNKEEELPVQVVHEIKEVIRDSVVEVKVPYEVVKEKVRYPRTYWLFLIILIFILGSKIYKLFKFVV